MKTKFTFQKDYKVIHFLPDIILVLKDNAFVDKSFIQFGWLLWIITIDL